MRAWAACHCSVTDQKQSCDCRLIGGLCLKFQRANYVANFYVANSWSRVSAVGVGREIDRDSARLSFHGKLC